MLPPGEADLQTPSSLPSEDLPATKKLAGICPGFDATQLGLQGTEPATIEIQIR